MKSLPRFIWCIFDGLRRDMITPDIAPRLRSFIDAGADFPSSRCVFPSVTRVNAAAMACGATPGATGVVANMLYDPRVYSDKLMQTRQYDHIAQAEKVYDGRFVTAHSLGDILADHGLKVAIVSSGSAGATHLLDPRAAQLGNVRLCLSDWRASTPADYAADVLERFGPIPPSAKPNATRIELQIDMVLGAVLPEIKPDVLIVWFSDPDSTYHYCGIGSPDSIAAIRHADAQFGRLLDHRTQAPDGADCQIIACSDHGLITARERIDVKPKMRNAGIRIGTSFSEGNVVAGSTSYCGALRIAADNEASMRDVVNWLLDQPWCGPVFTSGGNGMIGGVKGTLDHALLSLTHPRTPEVYYVMKANDTPDRWGWPGSCYFNEDAIPIGGATHGGLHPIEMNNLLALGGSTFKQGYVSPWPAGHTDIAPTILQAFGINAPSSMTGRALTEAYSRLATEPPQPQSVTYISESRSRRQHLNLWNVGATTYIDRGWTESV